MHAYTTHARTRQFHSVPLLFPFSSRSRSSFFTRFLPGPFSPPVRSSSARLCRHGRVNASLRSVRAKVVIRAAWNARFLLSPPHPPSEPTGDSLARQRPRRPPSQVHRDPRIISSDQLDARRSRNRFVTRSNQPIPPGHLLLGRK